MIFGKLICWMMGHKRGKRVPRIAEANQNWQTYRCPRCAATWTRKVKGPIKVADVTINERAMLPSSTVSEAKQP